MEVRIKLQLRINRVWMNCVRPVSLIHVCMRRKCDGFKSPPNINHPGSIHHAHMHDTPAHSCKVGCIRDQSAQLERSHYLDRRINAYFGVRQLTKCVRYKKSLIIWWIAMLVNGVIINYRPHAYQTRLAFWIIWLRNIKDPVILTHPPPRN